MEVSSKFGVVAIALASMTIPAQAQDSSVADRLNEKEILFEIDEDGDYKIVYNYSQEGRTQLVFVSGGTETVSGFSVREVYAPAALIEKDNIDGNRALELLRSSSQMKLGAWEIRGDALYFVIKVSDSVTASELESAMDIASATADDMEIELTGGRDDY